MKNLSDFERSRYFRFMGSPRTLIALTVMLIILVVLILFAPGAASARTLPTFEGPVSSTVTRCYNGNHGRFHGKVWSQMTKRPGGVRCITTAR